MRIHRGSRRGIVAVALMLLLAVVPSMSAQAAPLFTDGFESGLVPPWTAKGHFIRQQAIAHSGSWAGRATGASAYAYKSLPTPQANVYFDAWVRVVSNPGGVPVLRFLTGVGTNIASVNVNSAGALVRKIVPTGQDKTSATGVSKNAWHELQLHALIEGTSSVYEVWLDGRKVNDISGTVSLGTTKVRRVQLGTQGGTAAYDVLFDDVTADTSFIGGAIGPSKVIMAAGDIACDPTDVGWNGGNGTSARCHMKQTAALLSAADRVLAMGDTQYECGGAAAYAQSYDPTWGQYKNITYPAIGDQEYGLTGTDCGAAGADGYFGYFGPRAGDPAKGYYSFDFGGWHFVVLNAICGAGPQIGCAQGTPQNTWLERDLAANRSACTLAVLHKPLFASKRIGIQVAVTLKPFWDDLYAAHADIILDGNSHFYERFAKQNPGGSAVANGMVEFIVGTGGKSHGGLADPGLRLPNSQTATSSTFGVLKLTLHPSSYDWEYVVQGTSTFSDSGTANCV